jgi:DNA-binding transcriptional LysR family regulator
VPRRPADLRSHDCIACEALPPAEAWTFVDGKRAQSVRVRSRLCVDTVEAAVDAAIAGLGITRVLSYQVAAAVRAGKLAVALAPFEPPPWPVSLVYPRQRLLPQKLKAFAAFAIPRLKRAVAEASLR